MSSNNNTELKTLARYKRLPENSYSIVLKFANKKDRDDCINSKEFKEVYAELATLLINYNSSIELIKWDLLSGKKRHNGK